MYLIQNATIYAPALLGQADILTGGGKILEVGKGLSPNIKDLTVIDAREFMAVPGFIDQHVHVTGGGGEGGFHTRTPELMLSTAIQAGVTTLVGLLGTDSYTRSVENLVAKVKALRNEGLTTFCLTGAYRYPSDTLTGRVDRDITFIEEVIGCKLAVADHRCSNPTREELIRLVSDIRMASLVAGKPGLLHMHVGAAQKSGGLEQIMDIVKTTDIPVWHFRPTHMEQYPDQAVAFTKMGGYVDITANPEEAETFYAITKRAQPGLLTLSSDAGGSMPVWNEKRELTGIRVAGMDTLFGTVQALVQRLGLPLEQALVYITENVAHALRLYPQKGTLAVGSDADIVLLDKDLAIDSVFAGGMAMMLNKEVLVKGVFE